MNIVISQPMYFPWVGMFEQIALADVFVFYTDVQFSKGSFTNRVQLKTDAGSCWMTVPLNNLKFGQQIGEVAVKPPGDWKPRHHAMLRESLGHAPHFKDVEELLDQLPDSDTSTIAEVSSASMMAVCSYLGLDRNVRFVGIDQLGIGGKGSDRVLNVVKALEGTRYITGYGARNYLEHEVFEEAGVAVEYMDYKCTPYPQFHGEFTPYVSILDLIAHCGREGISRIHSGTKPWRSFVGESTP
jgi:hypothetical protein